MQQLTHILAKAAPYAAQSATAAVPRSGYVRPRYVRMPSATEYNDMHISIAKYSTR